MLRREMQREREREGQQQQQQEDGDEVGKGANAIRTQQRQAGQGVSELERTVKVRWPVDGSGGGITADRVQELFSTFGKVDSADLLTPKMLKLSGSKKKQLGVVCMVQFASVVGAHAAVEDSIKQEGAPEWNLFDTVHWAAGQAPSFVTAGRDPSPAGSQEKSTTSAPTTPAGAANGSTKNPLAHLKDNNTNASHAPIGSLNASANGTGVRKMPSFASFASPAATTRTPKSSSFYTAGLGPNSPSLEEVTMIRLKEAEKRRLAAEIQRQDEQADATAAAAAAADFNGS